MDEIFQFRRPHFMVFLDNSSFPSTEHKINDDTAIKKSLKIVRVLISWLVSSINPLMDKLIVSSVFGNLCFFRQNPYSFIR